MPQAKVGLRPPGKDAERRADSQDRMDHAPDCLSRMNGSLAGQHVRRPHHAPWGPERRRQLNHVSVSPDELAPEPSRPAHAGRVAVQGGRQLRAQLAARARGERVAVQQMRDVVVEAAQA